MPSRGRSEGGKRSWYYVRWKFRASFARSAVAAQSAPCSSSPRPSRPIQVESGLDRCCESRRHEIRGNIPELHGNGHEHECALEKSERCCAGTDRTNEPLLGGSFLAR